METLRIGGLPIPVRRYGTLVIGSGCAGFNAADWLYDLGRRDVALITEGVYKGTSRNAGSDKQTYYKLSLASGQPDSVGELARTLMGGIGVNADTALAEAAGSVKSFMKLVLLGVPFPQNEYGEYVGYKTDHDPRERATSAGPLTSRYMTECLERSVRGKGIPILNDMQAVRLIVREGRVYGLLALDLKQFDSGNPGFILFDCDTVILATGGPASVYSCSVYPESQTGATGMALEAGAPGANLQEWQYGLASVDFRWNVSGSYQQVLPRYIAVSPDGAQREFLPEYLDDPFEAVNRVFQKGYQWPFDAGKILGSSLIDMIVHHETITLGNRVFLDFRRNPSCVEEHGFGRLSPEAAGYLRKSGALSGTPVERLAIMNRPAIELYRRNRIDLYRQPLEIAVCAQHHNGGVAVDAYWQSALRGLYAAGEAAGTFGVYRPGGSALNSTQVGSMRAAEHIAFGRDAEEPRPAIFADAARDSLGDFIARCLALRGKPPADVAPMMEEAGRLMSRCAAHVRDTDGMRKAQEILRRRLDGVFDRRPEGPGGLGALLKYRDTLVTQLAVLSAMESAADACGSRGSALVLDPSGTALPRRLAMYRYAPPKDGHADQVMMTLATDGGFRSEFRPARPLPEPDEWFETVWNADRARRDRCARRSSEKETYKGGFP